ncbi:MAG: hypothetical protein ACP5G7_07385 [Anaerolineae bacterium]
MGWIYTVRGRVRPEDLGLTLPHEHIMVDFRRSSALQSGQDVELVMRYAPDDPTFRAGVGMTVYGPDGWSRQATVYDGERAVTIVNAPTGTYIVQIYNYIEGLEISYTLEE